MRSYPLNRDSYGAECTEIVGRVRSENGPSDLNKGYSGKVSRTRRWRELRELAMQRAGRKCELCGMADGVRGSLKAHHLNYERPNEERLEDIQILCSWCHGRAHSWWETEGKFLPDDHPAFDGLREVDVA